MTRVLREPLVHFFLLGALIFGVFAFVDDSPPPASANMLKVTEEDARRLVAEFEATWRRPPSQNELGHMIEQFIREAVYVREALALGLDRDDAVIRRRLQLKMEFLTESGAEAVEPDDATLQAHLDANPDRFAVAPLVGFEQILLDESVEDDDLERLMASLNEGADPGTAARRTPMPAVFQPSPEQVVDGSFGEGFFQALETLSLDVWDGPVETSLGRHLVRVKTRRAGRLPPLSEIRPSVERDWRTEFTQHLREKRYKALLDRYDVVRPDPAQVLSP